MRNRRKKLVFWRIEHRLRQRDMCEMLGITTAHYSNIERGLSNPSYELLVKFRKIFNVIDVIDLFEKEKEEFQNGNSNTSGDI